MVHIEADLLNVPERELIPAGTEVQVRVKSAELNRKEKETGESITIHLVLEPVWEGEVAEIHRYNSIKPWNLQQLCKCFGVELRTEGFDTEELVGQTGFAIVAIEPETDQGPARNSIKKWVVAK